MFLFWFTRSLGVVVITFTLRETFRDLFQPSVSGTLSSFVARAIFRAPKRLPALRSLAGPLAILVTVGCWVLLVASGFAMIYWPNMPNGFRVPDHTSPDPVSRFGLALYFSLEALTTLGQGDITPLGAWLRMLTISEGLLGFSLLTASISWVVLIYPALARTRTLARFAANLVRAEQQSGVSLLSGNVEQLIAEMAHDVIQTRVDFLLFPLIYYFYATSERGALPTALNHLVAMAKKASEESRPEGVRLASATLQVALDDLATVLAANFLKMEYSDPSKVFDAYERDHLTEELSHGES
jgi:hypothetical protein